MTENCSYKGHSFLFEQLGIAKEIGLAQAGEVHYRSTNVAQARRPSLITHHSPLFTSLFSISYQPHDSSSFFV